MKQLAFIALLLVFSCNNTIEDTSLLNGYWEIESVTDTEGNTKTFKVNTTVDYFKLTDSLTGFRAKVSPQLDGTYKSAGTSEGFTLVFENDSLNAYYKTPHAEWKETIVELDSFRLKVVNAENKTYLYKRF